MRVSLRARLLTWFMRTFIKPQSLRASTPQEARRVLDRVRSWPNSSVSYETTKIGGLSGEKIEGRSPAFGTLLYLHGGAYVAMSPKTHRAITGAFAAAGLRVFAPDYRLAPEHPFPAALDDATAAYAALSRERPGRIFIAGDSAGGGLALALLMRLRDSGGPQPAGAVLFSPWTDLAGTGASLRTNRLRDAVFYPDKLLETAAFYHGATDPRDPLVSPLYGAMAALPPLQIWVGEDEILRDDATRVADKATAAGVAVEIHVWPVVGHVWQLMAPLLPEARRSLDMAAAFLRTRAA